MKKLIFALLALITISSVTAWNGSGRGAVFGGLGGAAIGGAAGGRTGAIAGGLTGAALGSAIGASQDDYDYGSDDVYYSAPMVYERPSGTVVRKEFSSRPASTFAPASGSVIYVQ
jgi:hypothetical protein